MNSRLREDANPNAGTAPSTKDCVHEPHPGAAFFSIPVRWAARTPSETPGVMYAHVCRHCRTIYQTTPQEN